MQTFKYDRIVMSILLIIVSSVLLYNSLNKDHTKEQISYLDRYGQTITWSDTVFTIISSNETIVKKERIIYENKPLSISELETTAHNPEKVYIGRRCMQYLMIPLKIDTICYSLDKCED